MAAVENVAFVFVAGLLTALATGLGAIPFFLVEEFSDRWNVLLWGLASGIMVAASLFGLVREGLAYGSPILLVPGLRGPRPQGRRSPDPRGAGARL